MQVLKEVSDEVSQENRQRATKKGLLSKESLNKECGRNI